MTSALSSVHFATGAACISALPNQYITLVMVWAFVGRREILLGRWPQRKHFGMLPAAAPDDRRRAGRRNGSRKSLAGIPDFTGASFSLPANNASSHRCR